MADLDEIVGRETALFGFQTAPITSGSVFHEVVMKVSTGNYAELLIKYIASERHEALESSIFDSNGNNYLVGVSFDRPERESLASPYNIQLAVDMNPLLTKFSADYDLRNYPTERRRMLTDFTNNAEKRLTIFPRSFLGGILGFTYLGENNMGRRDDLHGELAREVDIHESIHTNCEYETRRIVEWILWPSIDRYIR